MKSLVYIGLFLSLTGCGIGDKKIPLTKGYTTIELQNIVSEVRANYPTKSPFTVENIAIVDKIEVEGVENPVGVCRTYETGEPVEILIDEDYWERSSYEAKLGLIAHELGHCDWGLNHHDSGLMHPHSHVSTAEIEQYGLLDSILYMLDFL